MTEKELIRQLKLVKTAYYDKLAPDAETVDKIHQIVMARVGQCGTAPVVVSKLSFFVGFLRYLVPPQLAYGVALLALVISSAVTATISQRALPGDSLYSAKLALEKTHARFVSNPASRAKVQMEFAGRRLEEAATAPTAMGAKEALQNFSQEVKSAKATLKEAADPLQVEEATYELAKKARQYKEKLQETQVRSTREVDVATLHDAEQALQEAQEPSVTDGDGGL